MPSTGAQTFQQFRLRTDIQFAVDGAEVVPHRAGAHVESAGDGRDAGAVDKSTHDFPLTVRQVSERGYVSQRRGGGARGHGEPSGSDLVGDADKGHFEIADAVWRRPPWIRLRTQREGEPGRIVQGGEVGAAPQPLVVLPANTNPYRRPSTGAMYIRDPCEQPRKVARMHRRQQGGSSEIDGPIAQ